VLTQAAFKQVPRSPGGHNSTHSTKWDSTKLEDKTLLHQAGPKSMSYSHHLTDTYHISTLHILIIIIIIITPIIPASHS